MSLILEALRKSEAERQIGRAPGLLTPMAMTTTPNAGRRGWLVGGLVVLVAVAIALAWWLGRNGQSAASTSNEPTAGELAPSAVPTPAAVSNVAVQSLPPPAADASVAPPAPRPLPAPGPADFPSDPDFESTERESLPVPAPASAAPPITAVPITAVPPPAVPTLAVPAEAVAPATAPIANAVPAGPATTPLSALTEAERTGLPPLRLSMHVFNAEPSRRFVMIDGRRRAEGDALAADVKLAEIRREGAVVDIRGRLVLIERP